MKTLHLSIISLTVISCLMTFIPVYAPPPIPPQVEYFNSDIVLIGKVISASFFSATQMKYEIQVEQYLKNPQAQNIITVIAEGTNKTLVDRGLAADTVFDVGQRAFLYLKNDHGNYTAWWFSHSTDSLCDPTPTKDDLNFEYPKGIDFAYEPLHVGASNASSYLYMVNEPVVISFNTWNRHYTFSKSDVIFQVKNGTDGTMIFNDTKQVELKPCIGHQTVTTSFVPKTSGTYEIDVIFDNSLQGTTLEIPKNHDMKTVPEFPFAVLILLISFVPVIAFYRRKFRK
jgi:predicted secreted protein with PEFG-CTERM motif